MCRGVTKRRGIEHADLTHLDGHMMARTLEYLKEYFRKALEA
jgi:hypothetical protein